MFAPFFFLPLFLFMLFVAFVVGVVVMAFAIVGGPDACTPGGGPIVVSEANADAFQTKWDAFDATLDSGATASVTFTESEVTSRAIRVMEGDLDDQDFLQNFRVCLHDGYGEISGTVNMPAFTDVKYRVRGTAQIDRELKVNVEEVEVGSVPGFFTDWLGDRIDRTADLFDEGEFDHRYVLTLSGGQAQIDGTP
jgi:hypothetical protein